MTAVPAPAALPELGDSSGALISPAAERQLGEQSMRQIRAAGAYLDDPEVNAYLDRLGQRLSAGGSGSTRFEFFAVASGDINAFALPGGFIGVNTGLILKTESESQLAAVLAHEITHVTQRHLARQLAAQSGTQVASLAAILAAILVGSHGGGQASSGLMTGAMAAQTQATINTTREHELEADRIGFERLVAAGFEPQAMATFFMRLQKATRLQETDVAPYLRSHPLTPQRIAEAEHRAADFPYRQIRDGDDFAFVQALLRSYQGRPEEAVARLAGDRSTSARRYGYAAALLRAGDLAGAQGEIQSLDRQLVQHPMLESLAALTLSQAGNHVLALRRYESALQHYPDHLQLVYDYPAALIRAGAPAPATEFIDARLRERRGDARLHELAAEAWAALGRNFKSHYHLGEQHAARGNPASAIEQFTLALRYADGDYREIAIAEARRRELQAAMQPTRQRGSDTPATRTMFGRP